MLRRRSLSGLALLLIVAGSVTSIAAGQTSGSTPPSEAPSSTVQRGSDEAAEPVLSVEFAGGSVKRFVDSVCAAARPHTVNVILPKDAESVEIPALSLRDVSAYTALQSIEYSAPEGCLFKLMPMGARGERSRTFAFKYMSQGSQSRTQQAQSAGAREESRVFSLRELVEAPVGLEQQPDAVESTETVLNAIRMATTLDPERKQPAPELMLHKESMLLLVRSSAEQIKTIESVIQALRASLDAKRSRTQDALDRDRAMQLEKADLHMQLQTLAIQGNQALDEVRQAESQREKLKKLVEAGQAGADSLSQAEAAVNHARATLQQIEASRMSVDQRRVLMETRIAMGAGAGSGERGQLIKVEYNYADLRAFQGDVVAICRALLTPERDAGGDALKESGDGVLVFKGTAKEHRVLVAALNAMRRAKANDPSLPGQDAADLMRKSEVK